MPLIAATLTVLLLVGAGTAPAGEALHDLDSRVREVLDLAGVRQKIDQFPRHVYRQLMQQPAPSDVKSQQAVARAVQDAFQSERLYSTIVDVSAKGFDADRGAAVAAALSSSAGRKLVSLEIEAARPEAMANMLTFAARMMVTDRPSPARVDLIRRLDAATATSTVNLELDVLVRRSLVRIVDVALPSAQRRNPPGGGVPLDAMRGDARAAAQTATEMVMLYTYRSISDEELSQYVAFAESDAGRWFSHLLRGAIASAIDTAGEHAVELTRRALSPGRSI